MAGSFRYQHGDRPLEGYTILRGIGRGGFGEVYYAVSDGGREVALKAIQQNHDIELRGVRHCINLKNPHLVSIFDVRKNAEDIPFVIMEYVAGPSIRDILRSAPGGLGAEKAIFLLREISRGLSYLHERGIVHRDLKPENIFFEDSYVKIGDYGLSKYISVSRQSGQTISVGTVHYMAPEIGSGSYHQGIDIYALGIIFYELLTGTVPFNGNSMGEILMKHLTCEPDVSSLDPALQHVARKALAKNPADRYQSAREMIDDALRDPGLAERVGRVDARELSSQIPGEAPPPREALETQFTPPPRRPAEGAGPAPPHAARNVPPTREPRARAPAGEAVEPGSAWKNIDQRLVPGLATAVATSLGLAFLARTRTGPWGMGGYFLLTVVVASAILWVEHWVAPRFQIGSGAIRRLLTLSIAGPLLAITYMATAAAFGIDNGSGRTIPALLAGLLCVDWNARVSRSRHEHVSLGSALSAGLFGLAAGAITKGNYGIAFGFLASLSLVLNSVSTHVATGERRRRQAGSRRDGVDPPPGPLPTADSPTAVVTPGGPAPPAFGWRLSHRRLVRPRKGKVVGGVCAAISAGYGWDVSWVRMWFVLLAVGVFPFGLLPYLVLWFVMPREPLEVETTLQARMTSLEGHLSPVSPRARVPILPRLFWYSLAIFCFAAGIIHVIRTGEGTNAVPLGLILLPVGAFAFLTAKARRQTHLARRDQPPALAALGTLGKVLVTLAFWAVMIDTYMGPHAAYKAPPAQRIEISTQRGWLPVVEAPITMVARAATMNWLLLTSIGLFLSGVCCLLVARQSGGIAHVVRGVFGWMAAGLLFAAVLATVSSRFESLWPSSDMLSPSSQPRIMILAATLLFLGVASAVCLAWPPRVLPRGGRLDLPAPEGVVA
ncbi:MAG TPA: protein kinase [Planctomycetota bacterium]|nr:protein kinase [Planctomycetota bacterium]